MHAQSMTSASRHTQDQTRAAYRRHQKRAAGIAQGLGWFSIGLGLAEFLAPHTITRALGMEGRETLVRMYGLREMANGAGLLSADNKAPWLWGRVGGDALDLATLSLGMEESNAKRDNAILATVMVGAITALDFYAAQRLDGLKQVQDAPDYSARSGFPKGARAVHGIAKDQAAVMRPRFIDNPPRYERQRQSAEAAL
ncbi:MAG: cyclase dehydrase [Hyphomicrobiales bacterium]|nr:cyclase dehydrase [Hyphomicrobiales bacterium]